MQDLPQCYHIHLLPAAFCTTHVRGRAWFVMLKMLREVSPEARTKAVEDDETAEIAWC